MSTQHAWAYLTNGKCMAYVICKVCFQTLEAHSISKISFRHLKCVSLFLASGRSSWGSWRGGGGLMSREVLACFGRDRMCALPLFLPPQGLLPAPIHPSLLPSYPHFSVLLFYPSTANQLCCLQCLFNHRVSTSDAHPTGELGKVDFKSRPWLVGLGGVVRKTTLENRQSR